MTRDDLIKEIRARRGNFPALVIVYLVILAGMASSAAAIL